MTRDEERALVRKAFEEVRRLLERGNVAGALAFIEVALRNPEPGK